MNIYKPEGMLISTPENREYLSSFASLERACMQGAILEANAIMCDENLNLYVDLGICKGIIEKKEAAYTNQGEEIKDIAIITRVGKAVCFKILGFEKQNGETVAILSRRAAQGECIRNYLLTLEKGDIVDARVTHNESFGAFVDIGCGVVSLLSIDCISVSRISHASDRFYLGMKIKVVIKEIDYESARIYVSHKELLGTWEENAEKFSIGQTVAGIVRSIEPYGVFIELMPNLAGLCEYHEGCTVGEVAAVYIKNIIPQRMKIKLVLIDNYKNEGKGERDTKQYDYFINESHISKWRYSPIECDKIIESVFDEENG